MTTKYKVWTGSGWTIYGGGGGGGSRIDWSRPSDWLTMPAMLTEGFQGLFAVSPTGTNKVALYASGDYTVDWGDGTVTNHVGTTKAEHVYTYSSIPAGTLTSRGYRQVLIVVTPQAGQTLSLVSLDARHSSLPTTLNSYHSNNWLDVQVQGASITTLNFSMNTSGSNSEAYCAMLEHIKVGTNAITDGRYLFADWYWENLSSLQSVEMDCSSLVDAEGICANSKTLRTVNFTNMNNVTSLISAFNYCTGLTYIELPALPNLTTFGDGFNYCTSLSEAIIGDMPLVTEVGDMFNSCYSLDNVILGNMNSLPNISYLFTYNYALKSVSLGNLDNVQNAYRMFYYAQGLKEITLGSMSSLTSADSMFSQCWALEKVTIGDCSSLSDAEYMFNYCYNLKELNFNIPASINFWNGIFRGCSSISSINFTDCANIISPTSTGGNGAPVTYCYSLTSLRVPNIRYSIDLRGTQLGRDAIIQVFNDLATVSVYTTVDLTRTTGKIDLTANDILIATNKGWTVLT